MDIHPRLTTAKQPLFRTVDLRVGQERQVELADGSQVRVRLIAVDETADSIRQAVRRAAVRVEVNGEEATLVSANYRLPRSVGGVQIDCPITAGYVKNSRQNAWAL